MKLIEVQPDVTFEVAQPNGMKAPQTFKFKDFLVEALDIYAPIGKSLRMMRQANRIVDVIETSNGHLALEDADYAVLRGALHLDDEAGAFNPILRRLEPFFAAVESAEDTKNSGAEK